MTMEGEIINRVANSKLVTFDLEDLYVPGNRVILDISQWLEEGFLLRESSFRQSLKDHDWTIYKDAYVALQCSTDAIIPAWAYMLAATYLQGITKKTITGSLETLETILYTEKINALNVSEYQNLPLIIKGCSNKPVPENAYLLLLEKLQPVVRSLMFGEACSSVPLYKKGR